MIRFSRLVALAFGVLACVAAGASTAAPTCKEGEELVGGKCRTACAPGTARATEPPWDCRPIASPRAR